MAINFAEHARTILAEAAYGMTTLDMDDLRESAQEARNAAVDSLTTYTSDCLDIIRDHDREVSDDDLEALIGGETFRAIDWRKAMERHAAAIVDVLLSEAIGEALDELEEADRNLRELACELGASEFPEGLEEPGARLEAYKSVLDHFAPSRCAGTGRNVYSDGQVDGCNAVSDRIGHLTISYSWAPKAAEGVQ